MEAKRARIAELLETARAHEPLDPQFWEGYIFGLEKALQILDGGKH
jgi:hypothetical protein